MAGGRLKAWIGRRFGASGRELAEARAQAERAEARLRDAIEAIPEGVVFLDAEGHIGKPIRVEALFAALETALEPQAAQAL